MNGYILLAFYIIGFTAFCFELIKNKTSEWLIIALFVFFVFAVVSRQYGYEDYSDLGAYITRFQSGDNSYFSYIYGVLTDLIRIFGTSASWFLICIASINLMCAIIAVRLIPKQTALFENGIKRNQTCTFIFLYAVYWGFSFSAEVIRSGLAISISLIVIALLLKPSDKKRLIFAVILYILSMLFHWTQIILLPFLLYLFFIKKVKVRKVSFYLILSAIMLILDMLDSSRIAMERLLPILSRIVKIFDVNNHYDVYLNIIVRQSRLEYISLQYIYYHLLGVFFACFKSNDKNYIRLLNGYYYGLSLFTLLNGVADAITRIQWPLLVLSVFLFYYFLQNKNFDKKEKIFSMLVYSATMAVMACRYLGIRF